MKHQDFISALEKCCVIDQGLCQTELKTFIQIAYLLRLLMLLSVETKTVFKKDNEKIRSLTKDV